MKINILYEDNHIIVVEKPINILSQKDNTNDQDLLSLVKEYIKEKYNKPGNVYLGLVHRLDRMVGGIMVFAKTSKAASRLSKAMNDNLFNKSYLAIVKGKVDEKGVFKDKIKRLNNGNSIISEDGKEAELEYELIEYKKDIDASLVKIHLITGRHHQIRIQFASRNHELLGDHRYSNTEDNLPIALYAYSLEFPHPVKKTSMQFTLYPKEYGYWKNFSIKK